MFTIRNSLHRRTYATKRDSNSSYASTTKKIYSLIDKYAALPSSNVDNIVDITKMKGKLQNLDAIIATHVIGHPNNLLKTDTREIGGDNQRSLTTNEREISDAFKIRNLVRAFRNRGHLVAKLDPLGRNLGQVTRGSETDAKTRASVPVEGVDLDILMNDYDKNRLIDDTTGRKLNLNEYLGLSDINEDREFYVGDDLATFDKADNGKLSWKAKDILGRLSAARIAARLPAEYTHLTSASKKLWLRKRLEPERAMQTTKDQKIKIMKRLTVADVFEEYLADAFPSAKRFGLEGAEGIVPGLVALVERASEQKCESIVLGMAHRGRLNVLSNIFQKPFGAIVSEMKDDKESFMVGDVCDHHLGLKSRVQVPMRNLTDVEESKEQAKNKKNARSIELEILPNPSHLEMVNAVVAGVTRGKQFKISPAHERTWR